MSRFNTSALLQLIVVITYIALIAISPSLNFAPSYMYLHDSKRLLSLVLLALVLIHSMSDPNACCNIIHIGNKVRNGFFMLLALACVSTLLAKTPRHALIEISIFASLCYLALFVAGLFHENKKVFIKRLTYALWISIGLYMFAFYVGYIAACVSKMPLRWPQPFTGFNNIRSFNQYQLWALGLVYLPLLAFELKKSTRLMLHIALTCWWVLLFYSASRGVLLAWVAGMLATALVYRKLAWPFLRMQLIHIATGFCSYYFLFKVIPTLLQLTLITGTVLRETTSDRIELWMKAFHLASDFPVFGVGPMNYPFYNFTMFHPHNSVLQLAAEWGLPATFIILSIAGYGTYCWLNRFSAKKLATESKLNSSFAILLFFTLITNAANSLVDGVIVMPISQVMMFTIIGLMIADYTYRQIAVTPKMSPIIGFRPIFAGVVLATMVWSTLPEIERGLSGYERGFSMGPDIVNPRIWINMRR